MATCWFCDRCGKQVTKDTDGAGKFDILVSGIDTGKTGRVEHYKRNLKFCPSCALVMEDIIDAELDLLPEETTVFLKKGN